jgi:HK97 family phage major capsid protein
MSTVKELVENRVKLIAEARALLEKNNGNFSQEVENQFDAMMKDADVMKNQIDRYTKISDLEKVHNAPVEQPNFGGMQATSSANDIHARKTREYLDAFWNVVRYDQPFTHFKNVLQIGTNPAGGFLLPTEFERQMVAALDLNNIMRPLADVMTTSNDRDIPIESDYGVATWTAENAAYGESDSVFAQITLASHKLTRLTKVSEELMQDAAFDMGAYLATAFGRSFGKAEEAAMIDGNGTGRPLGVTSTTNTLNFAGAAAITSDEILSMYHKLKQPYRPNAVWIMHEDTLLLCRKLKDTSGAYYFVPAMTAGMPDTFLGKPVYTSEFMPAATTGLKSVLFGNMKYYRIGDRQTRTMQRLNELYAATGQVGFIGRQRVDGKLLLDEAVVAGVQA